MSLAFLLPLGFAALAAWALPLLIHLSRRADRRETPFAALRWIRGPERPRRRLRLEHPWLLLARLALLAALAFLLAEPVLDAPVRDDRAWVAVVPGADLTQAREAAAADASWHWVAPGFPAIGATGTPPSDTSASVASLLRELDANLAPATTLTVVAPNELGGLDAERVTLNRRVDWRVVAGASPQTPADAATRIVALRVAPEAAAALPYLRAAIAAWNTPTQRYRLDEAALDAPVPSDATWIVRLGADTTPDVLARVADGATMLTDRPSDGAAAWHDANGRVLARAATHGRGRVIGLAQPLTPAALPAMLESTFAQDLERVLLGPATPSRAPAAAVAPLQVARDVTPARTGAIGIDDTVIGLIALLLVIERLLAWRASRKEATP